MRIRPTVEWQTVAVCLLWLGLIRVITAPLALPGLVATTPVRAGKHEVLFAGDAATPHERGDGNQREKRTGNPAQHHFIMPQSGAGGGCDSAFTCACSGWCDASGLWELILADDAEAEFIVAGRREIREDGTSY